MTAMTEKKEKVYLSEEQRLMESITSKINPIVPPHAENISTNVHFGLALLQIIELVRHMFLTNYAIDNFYQNFTVN